ncbi:right-handed parallel beta-helix repeat-containing protein [Propionibacteriaceae bacterium Y2011]
MSEHVPERIDRRRGLLAAAAAGTVGLVGALGSSRPAEAAPQSGVSPFDGEIHDVTDHGAVGDGTADDTGAIQATIDAAGDGGGVFLPPGTYRVTGVLRPRKDQLIFGAAGRPVIRAAVGGSIFAVTRGAVTFHRLHLDGARSITPEPPVPNNERLIYAAATAAVPAIDLTVTDCVVQDGWGEGIRVLGRHHAEDRVIVRDTKISNCQSFGMRMQFTDHGHIENCDFIANRHGFSGDEVKHVTVQGCRTIENDGHGVVFTYSQYWHVRGCRAERNGLVNSVGWGICAGGLFRDPVPAWNRDFTITDNVCDGNGSGGITLDPTVRQFPEKILDQNAVISGNTCRNTTKIHGINITHCRDVIVTNNVCTDNPISGIQVSSSSHVMVAGNICTRNRFGVNLSSNDTVEDPGHHEIGVNHLYDNVQDRNTEAFEGTYPMSGNWWHGLRGAGSPEGVVLADPGHTYHRTDDGDGSLYVKVTGTNSATGWQRSVVAPKP